VPRSGVSTPVHEGLTVLAGALNAGDVSAAAGAFADDGTLWIMPFETTAQGRSAVEAMLGRILGAVTDLDVEAVPDDDADAVRLALRGRLAPATPAVPADSTPDPAAPAPSAGKPFEAALRVTVDSDGDVIRSLTVWLDDQDLRALLTLGMEDGGQHLLTAMSREIVLLQQRLFAASQAEAEVDRRRRARQRKARLGVAVAVGLAVTSVAVTAGVAWARTVHWTTAAKPAAATPAAADPTGNPTAKPTVPAEPVAAPTTSPAKPPAPAPPPTIIRLSSTLLFAGDSAVLKPDARASIVAVAQQIRAHAHGAVTVTGYTADVGGHDNALQLSGDRASVVADVLRSALTGTTITVTAQGLGTANPVAPNDTEAGRAKNRRVEIAYSGTD
jgi:outer membrane protein OmpA-like peptidoglycan-associated protein